MFETLDKPKPIVLETDQPSLSLVQMTTLAEDSELFELQKQNMDHIAEFGNKIYSSVEEVTKFRLEGDKYRFGVRKDGNLIGVAGYVPVGNNQQAEIGIVLAKDSTGHGYATSAIRSLTSYLTPRYARVFAETAPDNLGSINLLERTGFKNSGHIIQRSWGQALVFEFYEEPPKD